MFNAMFIEPKAKKTAAYGCPTGFSDEAGAAGALRDDGGNPIPAQLEP